MLAALQSTNHEWITNALRGIRGRAGLHLLLFPLKYRGKKRSLGVFDNKDFQRKSTSRELPGLFSMSSFSYGLYFSTTVTKLQRQTGLFVVGRCAASCVLAVCTVCKQLSGWIVVTVLPHSRKPATQWDCLSRTAQGGAPSYVRDSAGDTCPCPSCAVTPQGLLGNRAVWGLYFHFLGWLSACPLLATDSVIQTWLRG